MSLMNVQHLPYDIFQCIADYLDGTSRVCLYRVNKYCCSLKIKRTQKQIDNNLVEDRLAYYAPLLNRIDNSCKDEKNIFEILPGVHAKTSFHVVHRKEKFCCTATLYPSFTKQHNSMYSEQTIFLLVQYMEAVLWKKYQSLLKEREYTLILKFNLNSVYYGTFPLALQFQWLNYRAYKRNQFTCFLATKLYEAFLFVYKIETCQRVSIAQWPVWDVEHDYSFLNEEGVEPFYQILPTMDDKTLTFDIHYKNEYFRTIEHEPYNTCSIVTLYATGNISSSKKQKMYDATCTILHAVDYVKKYSLHTWNRIELKIRPLNLKYNESYEGPPCIDIFLEKNDLGSETLLYKIYSLLLEAEHLFEKQDTYKCHYTMS